MKYIKLVAIVFSIALIVNCAKKEEVKTYEQYEENGIRVTKNNGIPADSTLKIDLKEVGFIDIENNEDSIRYVESARWFNFDEEDNLYFIDSKKCRVHKYDKEGKFITAFGRNGNGPGEFFLPGGINVRKDTIFVSNWTSLKLVKFDHNGKYLTDKVYPSNDKFPAYPAKFGVNYINRSTNSQSSEDNIIKMQEQVALYDEYFNFVKYLYNLEYESNMDKEEDPSEKGVISTISYNEIYISVNSKNLYKIDVYDENGEKIREIRKNYAKQRLSEEVAAKWAEQGEEYGMKWKATYKNSITGMQIDKYNRLWVNSSVIEKEDKESQYYDIFENDVFLKRIKLEIEEGYFPQIVDDKIIGINRDNNNIKIYEY